MVHTRCGVNPSVMPLRMVGRHRLCNAIFQDGGGLACPRGTAGSGGDALLLPQHQSTNLLDSMAVSMAVSGHDPPGHPEG